MNKANRVTIMLARLYEGDWHFWQTKAINYVWASNTLQETSWPNAFAGEKLMMLALRGPEATLNAWQTEKRNVRTDLHRLFGEDIRYIDAVALMTDTDNRQSQASAFYGDIWFSKDRPRFVQFEAVSISQYPNLCITWLN
nr:DUF3047 domain-containing protein [Methylomonas methanica]